MDARDGNGDPFAPRARPAKRDARSDEALGARARRDDAPRALEPGDLRQLRTNPILAANEEQIGGVYRPRLDGDDDLAGGRRRLGRLLDREDGARIARSVKREGFHADLFRASMPRVLGLVTWRACS